MGGMQDLKLVVAFAFHTVVAVFLFLLIGGAVTLLNYYVETLERIGMPPMIPEAVKATEYFLFAVDLLCFVVYVAREALILLRAMISPEAHDVALELPRILPPAETG